MRDAYALVVAAAFGGAATLIAVEIGRKAVRCWRYITALQRAERRDDGLSVVEAVRIGAEPAPARHRLPRRTPGAARMDDATVRLSLLAIDEATHELAHLQDARTEIHR